MLLGRGKSPEVYISLFALNRCAVAGANLLVVLSSELGVILSLYRSFSSLP